MRSRDHFVGHSTLESALSVWKHRSRYFSSSVNTRTNISTLQLFFTGAIPKDQLIHVYVCLSVLFVFPLMSHFQHPDDNSLILLKYLNFSLTIFDHFLFFFLNSQLASSQHCCSLHYLSSLSDCWICNSNEGEARAKSQMAAWPKYSIRFQKTAQNHHVT